jgi:hypothetical protein
VDPSFRGNRMSVATMATADRWQSCVSLQKVSG